MGPGCGMDCQLVLGLLTTKKISKRNVKNIFLKRWKTLKIVNILNKWRVFNSPTICDI